MNKFNCLCCGRENTIKRTNMNKYCDNTCQASHQLTTITLPKFFLGKLSNRRTIHRIMKHLHGYKCVLCSNDGTHNGNALALQLDHIDGDAGNNLPSNLRLLCPNCHSQTETFVARNKGRGRQARGLFR